MFVPMFFDGRTVRGKPFVVMIAFRLSVVVIAHAIQEDHQHSPRDEEQDRSSERVN
jgi:hypothetical protein